MYSATLSNESRDVGAQIEVPTLKELQERIGAEWIPILADGDHIHIRHLDADVEKDVSTSSKPPAKPSTDAQRATLAQMRRRRRAGLLRVLNDPEGGREEYAEAAAQCEFLQRELVRHGVDVRALDRTDGDERRAMDRAGRDQSRRRGAGGAAVGGGVRRDVLS